MLEINRQEERSK